MINQEIEIEILKIDLKNELNKLENLYENQSAFIMDYFNSLRNEVDINAELALLGSQGRNETSKPK